MMVGMMLPSAAPAILKAVSLAQKRPLGWAAFRRRCSFAAGYPYGLDRIQLRSDTSAVGARFRASAIRDNGNPQPRGRRAVGHCRRALPVDNGAGFLHCIQQNKLCLAIGSESPLVNYDAEKRSLGPYRSLVMFSANDRFLPRRPGLRHSFFQTTRATIYESKCAIQDPGRGSRVARVK
jgi:hypothetical protein